MASFQVGTPRVAFGSPATAVAVGPAGVAVVALVVAVAVATAGVPALFVALEAVVDATVGAVVAAVVGLTVALGAAVTAAVVAGLVASAAFVPVAATVGSPVVGVVTLGPWLVAVGILVRT
jgi:hypothetical protein